MKEQSKVCPYFSIGKFCSSEHNVIDKEFSETICKVPNKYSLCFHFKKQSYPVYTKTE
jgi:hypothetical protein